MIATEFVKGGRPTDAQGGCESPEVWHELGDLLGRLHALPEGAGAVARDGGAEETEGGFYVGRPERDLAAAMSFLVGVEDRVSPDGREKFEWLRDQIENADGATGLPEALTHSNFHLWAAVGMPGSLVLIGWAGAGRGARLPALAWLLRTAAEAGPDNVTAVTRGYRDHVQLDDAELTRLPAILNLRPLWLACLEYRMGVESGKPPAMEEGWLRPGSADYAARLAERVTTALRS